MRMAGEDFIEFAPRARQWISDGMIDQAPAILSRFEINTPLRISHFMAQIAHESASFDTFEEYASGSAYEGRKDLGNVRKGDGRRYKGRGPIQLTGRYNYRAFTKWMQEQDPDAPDFEKQPKLVGKFPYGLLASVWYWDSRNLNKHADKNDIKRITKLINGGYRGLSQRKAWFQKAWAVWHDEPELETATKGKPLVKKKTVWATVAKSGVSIGSVAAATGSIGDVQENVKGLVGEGSLPSSGTVLIVAVIVIVALGGYIIYREHRLGTDYSI